MKPKRFIGLDYGDKTIGVALGCPDNRVATGLTTIRRDNPEAMRPSINAIKEIIREYSITNIVLGQPRHMDGSVSLREEKTLAFRDRLNRNFKSIQVDLWDERLSTQAVGRAFDGGFKRKKHREDYNNHVDEMAAVYILQGFLDHQNIAQCAIPTGSETGLCPVLRRGLGQSPIKMEVHMENETKLPVQGDTDNDLNEIIVMTDEDGNETELHVLASKRDGDDFYLLTAEVLHFKCKMDFNADTEDKTEDDEDNMELDLVSKGHADFARVKELFRENYKTLKIAIDEEDPLFAEEK